MAKIVSIAYHLPDKVLTNEELAERFPAWSSEKIFSKTGILRRHIAADTETAGDLALRAAEKLLSSLSIDRSEIDLVILVTQTPDQYLPSTSCRIQQELGLSTTCGTLDINQGCSGYIYGLATASGMISTRTASNVLLLTADTYSKLIDPNDHRVATLFGDAGTATLIQPDRNDDQPGIGPTQFGTDGSGSEFLYCNQGGWRVPLEHQSPLHMDGPSILSFTLSVLPLSLQAYLSRCGLSILDYHHVVFHQANKFILDKLYSKIGASSNGIISIDSSGNTVSSTIPIALSTLMHDVVSPGDRRVLLGGFGVGLSWGFTTIII